MLGRWGNKGELELSAFDKNRRNNKNESQHHLFWSLKHLKSSSTSSFAHHSDLTHLNASKFQLYYFVYIC